MVICLAGGRLVRDGTPLRTFKVGGECLPLVLDKGLSEELLGSLPPHGIRCDGLVEENTAVVLGTDYRGNTVLDVIVAHAASKIALVLVGLGASLELLP